MYSERLAISCFFMIIVLYGVDGKLECFSCTTATDGDTCGDQNGFTAYRKQTDNFGGQECQMCTKFKAKSGGTESIVRSCLPTSIGLSSGDCTEASQGGFSGSICYCNANLCNAGSSSCFSKTLLVISLVLSAICCIILSK